MSCLPTVIAGPGGAAARNRPSTVVDFWNINEYKMLAMPAQSIRGPLDGQRLAVTAHIPVRRRCR